jgi:hypothetical protein
MRRDDVWLTSGDGATAALTPADIARRERPVAASGIVGIV